jgi:hypothetical protein
MSNERFKQKMAALEKERDDFISQLTPEGQQEFLQKQKDYHQEAESTPPKVVNTWTKNNAAENK